MMTRGAFVSLSLVLLSIQTIYAQEKDNPNGQLKERKSCNEFAPPSKQSMGHTVGIEQCDIISEEIVFDSRGHKFRRVEMRLTGTVEGWASLETPKNRSNYFTDGPDFVFTQSGLTGPRARGIARYRADTGHGITIFYPEEAGHWNGKLFMTAHGALPYTPVGALMPRDASLKFNPLQSGNKYVGLMIDKGYAVGHTMRSTNLHGGDIEVTLEDGKKLEERNLGSHAGLMIGWTKLTQNFVLRRVGSIPKRTYLYGHSAGGFLARQINYQPGVNVGPDGKPVFDGFLADDAGGGLWLPKLVVDGKDILFATDEDRQKFVKQIDVSHVLYLGVTGDYLQKKRENALMLREKGLGTKHRVYEIRGVSHLDAGSVPRLYFMHENLDLSGLFDALIDRLDQWVENNTPAPPSRSDLAEFGDLHKDGVLENPAVALPEIACPLGVYYTFPPTLSPAVRLSGQVTGFALFDGTSFEPLDSRAQFVDMNNNGVRDTRETVTQAWQRLGLLQQGQKFSRSVYVECVKTAATKLVEGRLLPEKVYEAYAEQATRTRLPE